MILFKGIQIKQLSKNWKQMNECMYEWMNEWMNERMNE